VRCFKKFHNPGEDMPGLPLAIPSPEIRDGREP
jgi:hypothetical protein